ncbi:MAG: methyltransferase [Acholeplasmatales bacterium]|jgi:23S rRNA (uracil1939-C5)-methyltransferase|nr:methyltransferase [Acholeplasmatales bacterium]
MDYKIGDLITLECTNLDYEGKGFYKDDNYFYFIDDCLPNEKVICKIRKIKDKLIFLVIEEFITKNPFRTKDTPNFLGSIDFDYVSDEYQSLLCASIIKDQLSKMLKQDITVNESLCDNHTLNYRNKVVFEVLESDTLKLGLYLRNSKKLYKVNDFCLAPANINELLVLLNNSNIHIDYKSLKNIVFRTNTKNEILVTLVSKFEHFKGVKEIVSLLKKNPYIKGITLNISKNSKYILGDTSIILYGENTLEMNLNDHIIYINDRSFFQVNFYLIPKVYDKIKSYIKEGSTVIDAYCGSGSIGFYIASKASSLYLIDENKESIASTIKTYQNNPKLYGNMEIIASDVKDKLQNLDADYLIVDPARDGLSNSVIEIILSKKYNNIIYLSCNIVSLSLNLMKLVSIYDIKEVTPIKLFPNTKSFECLVLLKLK